MRVDGEGPLVNGAHFVGVAQCERRQHRIAIREELIQRALGGAGPERDGFGRGGVEPLFGDHGGGGIEQQFHAGLPAGLTRAPTVGVGRLGVGGHRGCGHRGCGRRG